MTSEPSERFSDKTVSASHLDANDSAARSGANAVSVDTGVRDSAASERRFRAMGTDIHVIVVGGPGGLIDQAEGRIRHLETLWSRFLPDSEVSQLTRNAGRPVIVSPETTRLVTRSIEAWRLTGGAFDPTVLGAVLNAGYNRSFDELDASVPVVPSHLLVGCTDIVVAGNTVCLPPNTGFDAGGIGKGLAADIVTEEAMAAEAGGVCINLGGDLRVAGRGPDGDAWTIAVEYPGLAEPVVLIGMTEGAVATSTTVKRAWVADGKARHHLIDPQTGEPSDTDLTLATVIAGEAWMAEVLAKAVILRGARRAFDLLDPSVADALVVDRHGNIDATEGFAAYTGSVGVPLRLKLPDSPQAWSDL
jgi:FAD:protein FMN transferase